MQQGSALADKGAYAAAFNSFRQAYGYDPVNQLAVSEMQRMLRMQEQLKNSDSRATITDGVSENFRQIDYRTANGATGQDRAVLPRTEQLRVISYKGDLEALITSLADQIDINVVFDTQSFSQPRNIRINLRDITTVKALDLIFLKEGLFFQKVDRRTILVADQTRRGQYQQLVLRTFYLANIEPQDAQRLVQAAIPPSVGRPMSIVTPEKSTNSLTVRDTAENVRLIGELLKNIDKERAEVVMDVQIYEVSVTDLLQIGNQLGSEATLANLGGASSLSTILGSRQVAQQVFTATTALGAALVLPASTISLLQKKGRTRLVASTQIHAFDGEKSEVHIGQRVPVQTAQVFTATNSTAGTTATGVYGTTGYPVINYEPTGLTLEFTPQVYPNRDVQVKMSIKSNDVASATALTPTFTERTLSGTARIQNNQTMMIASISQDQQSQTRAGLPLVGLVPILGRLFTAPSNDGKRTDIVVAVTPRVLRAPAITPRDERMLVSGTSQAPTTESLGAMVNEADREDQLASANAIAIPASKVLLDEDPPAYMPSPKSAASHVNAGLQDLTNRAFPGISVSNAMLLAASASAGGNQSTIFKEATGSRNSGAAAIGFELTPVVAHEKLRVGEKTTVKLLVRAAELVPKPISFAALKLKFDPSVIEARNILSGELYTAGSSGARIEQSLTENGELVILISGATTRGEGELLSFTIEALQKGVTSIELVRDAVHLITTDGREVSLGQSGKVRVTVE